MIREYTVTYYDVECDECKQLFMDGLADDEDQIEVEQLAADHGWMIMRLADAEPDDCEAVIGVLCPDCQGVKREDK